MTGPRGWWFGSQLSEAFLSVWDNLVPFPLYHNPHIREHTYRYMMIPSRYNSKVRTAEKELWAKVMLQSEMYFIHSSETIQAQQIPP